MLEFAEAPQETALTSLKLQCGAGTPKIDADLLGKRVVVNPRAELPAGSQCRLSWRGPEGNQSLEFGIAEAGAPAIIAYDREDKSLVAPWPDDVFLEDDADAVTGHRFVVPAIDQPSDVKAIATAILTGMEGLDGFSPLAPLVVPVPAALDAASLPMNRRLPSIRWQQLGYSTWTQRARATGSGLRSIWWFAKK